MSVLTQDEFYLDGNNVVVPSLDFYKPFSCMNQQMFSDLQFQLYDKDFMHDGGNFLFF